jgi:hypothetical protein
MGLDERFFAGVFGRGKNNDDEQRQVLPSIVKEDHLFAVSWRSGG